MADALEGPGVPCNAVEDVTRAMVHALASPDNASGEAYYVSGGRAYEIEKSADGGLRALRPRWLGADLDRGTAAFEDAFYQVRCVALRFFTIQFSPYSSSSSPSPSPAPARIPSCISQLSLFL